jgi:putative flippase GtrA
MTLHLLRLVKFGVVGCAGIIVDSITWLCKEKLRWNKYVASATGFSLAVINNFLLNRYYTFNQHNTIEGSQFIAFFIVSALGLLLSTAILFLLQKKTRLNFYISKAIAILLVFLWNYSANAFYTFR